MSTLKLRPWPFEENEEIELYWHGSPYLNSEGLWMIRCLFKSENDLFKEVAFPFGTLPHLRIGQFYKDGIISERTGKGKLIKIEVSSTTADTIVFCKGFNFPKSLYAFDKRPAPVYGNLPLCKFEIRGNFYYIPCTEIIRSILAPYKAFANQLLRPDGLDNFIESFFVDGDRLEINLNEEYPITLLNDDIVSYLAWLKFDNSTSESWSSVYNNLLLDTSEKNINAIGEPQNDIFIRVMPPMSDNSIWTFRGLSYKNHILILELIYRSNLNIPFKAIEYYHPRLEKIETDNKPRYIKDPDKKPLGGEDIELDNSGQGSEKRSNLNTVEQPPIWFGFRNKPRIYKKRSKTRNVHNGKTVIIGERKDEGSDSNTGTTQDWVRGGKIPQIEFSILKMADISLSKGLEDFILVFNHIRTLHKDWNMSLSIVNLPPLKKFSYYEDGSLRTCAIICVERHGELPCYLLEVSRADRWSISTLIIKPARSEVGKVEVAERLIQELLTSMVNHGGHWDTEQFRSKREYIFEAAKHVSGQPVIRWAERIVEKLF